MTTMNINVRVDTKLKQSAEKLFKDLGLNLSSAIILFLKKSVSMNRIPFDIKQDIPNSETIEALEEYTEMKNNPKKYKRYSSFDQVIKEVLSK